MFVGVGERESLLSGNCSEADIAVAGKRGLIHVSVPVSAREECGMNARLAAAAAAAGE